MDVTSLLLVTLVAITGCQQPSPFRPDAGSPDEIDGGIPLEEIGKPCVYNPARPNDPPTNQCFGGLICAITTRDYKEALLNDERRRPGFNTLGLSFPIHEDHFTVHNDDGTDTGYCTIAGTESAPPRCPVGTIAKRFTNGDTFTIACLKPCTASAECENGGVCDARYFDDDPGNTGRAGTIGFCVRPCTADFPDCIRTGVTFFDLTDTTNTKIATQLHSSDLFGGQTCNQTSGLCEDTAAVGPGTDGDACDDTNQCADGSLCIQLDASGNRLDKGFCARRCFVGEQSAGLEGTCGTQLCQPAMTFGFPAIPAFDPEGLYPTAPPAATSTVTRFLNGLCFDPCVEGFGCDADRPDVQCGAVDAVEAGGAWNERSMCLPPGILLETD